MDGVTTITQAFVGLARRSGRFLTECLVWAGLDDAPQEALPGLEAASVEGRSAVTGAPATQFQQLGGRSFELLPWCAVFERHNLQGNCCG